MIECGPMTSAVSVKDACPLMRFAVPRLVAPSWRVTLPVAVPAPGATALTVAVMTTDWPKTLGFAEEVSATTVAALFTIWDKGDEVLELKLLSPP